MLVMCVTSEATVADKLRKSEMNHKISVYCVDWRVLIQLLLALIVQCRYVFFCSKVHHRYNITLLGDHMSIKVQFSMPLDTQKHSREFQETLC